MLEMRYLWRVPAELDNTKLLSVIEVEPHTPLEEAVTTALASQASAPEETRARLSP